MLVNSKNHVAVNFQRRQGAWLARRVKKRFPNLPTSLRRSFVSTLYAQTVWKKQPGYWGWVEKKKVADELAENMHTLADELQKECDSGFGPAPVTDSNLQQKWISFMPWLYKLLQETPDDEKKFTMMPEHGFVPIFATVDLRVLHSLYRTISKETPSLAKFTEKTAQHGGKELFILAELRAMVANLRGL